MRLGFVTSLDSPAVLILGFKSRQLSGKLYDVYIHKQETGYYYYYYIIITRRCRSMWCIVLCTSPGCIEQQQAALSSGRVDKAARCCCSSKASGGLLLVSSTPTLTAVSHTELTPKFRGNFGRALSLRIIRGGFKSMNVSN